MAYLFITMTLLFGGKTASDDEYARLRDAAVTELEMGRYSKAEILILRSLDAARKSNNEFGAALNYSALGDIYQAQLRMGEAEKVYRKALSILSQQPGRGHAAAIVWRNLGSALTGEMRYGEALAALERATDLVTKNRVKDNQLDAAILNTLGVVYFHTGKLTKAERCFLQASELRFATRSALDVEMWEVMNNLGRVYDTTRRYGEAENAYRRSLQLVAAQFGESHLNASVVHGNLATLYSMTRRYEEAEVEFRRSLAILERPGADSDELLLMRTLYGLGLTYIRKSDAVQAQPVLARATEIARKRGLRENMPETLSILEAYASVIEDRSNPEVERLQVEVKRIRAVMAFTVPVQQAK